MATMRANTIFTNVALTPTRATCGGRARPPSRPRSWSTGAARLDARQRAAGRAPERPLHRARRTSARRSPTTGTRPTACRSTRSSSAAGAPRTCRSSSEAVDWTDGVFMGATIAERADRRRGGPGRRAAVRPFAMQPFCGYNMADHWAHWLDIGPAPRPARAPRIFRVNWFRKDADGAYVWPGFGDNIRVLDWIVRRLEHEVEAAASPIGLLPRRHDLDLEGLELSDDAIRTMLALDPQRLAQRGPADRAALRPVRRPPARRRSRTAAAPPARSRRATRDDRCARRRRAHDGASPTAAGRCCASSRRRPRSTSTAAPSRPGTCSSGSTAPGSRAPRRGAGRTA